MADADRPGAGTAARTGESASRVEVDSATRRNEPPTTWLLSRRLFLVTLGLVYLAAFSSLWIQLDGLIGSQGISPAAQLLERTAAGLQSLLRIPTLFWISAGDTALHTACGLGVAASLLVVAGLAPGPALALLWLLYLSFVSVGGVFLSYQWDTLLLETGLLACFLAPWQLLPSRGRLAPEATVSRWALRWLLFRLVFASGVTKLASGDPTWSDLTALEFHYYTQPIPNFASYYAHHLPDAFHTFATAATLAIELLAPLLILTRGWGPALAAGAIAALMLAIGATGNYGFFNLLTLALCVLLVDDRRIRALLPVRWRKALPPAPRRPVGTLARTRGVAAAAIVITLGAIGTLRTLDRIGVWIAWPAPVVDLVQIAGPFHSANSYGLFAVMTTKRPEILVEGSDDGTRWQLYDFRWKPDRLEQAPGSALLHMPRLDWQMWFAALGSCARNPWFVRFQERLLANSAAVTKLLKSNPFPDRAPRYLRSTVYRYEFTQPGSAGGGRNWWQRTRVGRYCPVMMRRID